MLKNIPRSSSPSLVCARIRLGVIYFCLAGSLTGFGTGLTGLAFSTKYQTGLTGLVTGLTGATLINLFLVLIFRICLFTPPLGDI